MSDLSSKKAGQTVKIAGGNPSTGDESYFMDIDSSGRPTVNQGVPNSVANAWPAKVTDGTNTQAVKAASTAAAAADPAAVVSLSPNSPTPPGTNIIGFVNPDVAPATQTITAFDTGTTTFAGANSQAFYTGTPTINSTATFALSSVETTNIQASLLGVGGTMVVEVSMDGGVFWFRPNVFQFATQNYTNSFTSPFAVAVNTAGMTHVRVRAITSWSGTATIKVIESVKTKSIAIGESLPPGTNNIGTITLPTGAASAANQSTEITSLQLIDNVIGPTAPGAVAANSSLVGGQYNVTPPTVADTQQVALQVDANGKLLTALPTNAATAANQATEITSLQLIDNVIGPVAPGTAGTGSALVGAQYNTSLPSPTNGQQVALQVDSLGRLITAPVQVSPLPATGSGFSFGDVATSSTAQAKVERTAYTEQTTNSTMSIASSSALDTSAGTGARTVTITYYDQTMAGPFTTVATLNGVTFVNLVSGMCYIEKIVVSTVGSNNSNAGILTLKATTAGGGATVGTIGVGDNQTFWTHHYVASGKTCYISGFTVSNNQTVAGNGAVFLLAKATPTVANTPTAMQISDFHTLAGQNAASISRTYLSPIQVTGPAKVTAYVIPLSGVAATQRASFDFIDN